MIKIPINAENFSTSFLKGNGNLEIESERWKDLFDAGARFSTETDQFAEVAVSADATEDFRFGRNDTLQLGISGGFTGGQSIRLIWPSEGPDSADPAIDTYELHHPKAGQLYLHLKLNAKGYGKASATIPVGPVAMAINSDAGGGVEYERFKIYDANNTVQQILGDLLGTLALPQQVDQLQEIPAPGELIVLRYDGYLGLSAGLTWGYSFAGSRKTDVNALSLDYEYAMRLAASLSVGYRLAGSFDIEARRGEFNADGENKWVRFVVRKSRQSQFNFAADFGFTSDFKLAGLPATADDFLAKLMGGNAERVLQGLEKATQYSDLEKLKTAVQDRLTKALVDDLAMKWVDEALGNAGVVAVLSRVEQAVKLYNELDDRIIHLYEDVLAEIPELNKINEVLETISGLQDPATLENLVAKTATSDVHRQAWSLIKRFWGDRIHDVLLSSEEITRVGEFARTAHKFLTDEGFEDVRNVISSIKEASRLDPLFETLKNFDTPAELRQEADERLKGVVERIVGKAFDELDDSDLGNNLEKLHSALEKIQDFKTNSYKKILEKAAGQSFSMELAYNYSRVDTKKALLDVEINLEHPEGSTLANLASHGQFAELLERYDTDIVRVRSGLLTHKLQKTSQLRINLFGWGYTSLVEIVSDTEHAIESQERGLLHVYTTTAAVRQQKERGREGSLESTTSNFLFRAITEKLQESRDPSVLDPKTKKFLADTLRDLSVSYDLTIDDRDTKPKELRQYMAFAQLIGLIKNGEDYIDKLEAEFPAGLGRVKASYVVRYDAAGVMYAFARSKSQLRAQARVIMRHYIAAKYTGMRQVDHAAPIGFAYLEGRGFEIHAEPRFIHQAGLQVLYRLPGWFTEGSEKVGALTLQNRRILSKLYSREIRYLDRFVALDDLIDVLNDPGDEDGERESISVQALEEAARDFVSMAAGLDEFRENAFFAIFDGLIRLNSARTQGGRSALILEITPPGTDVTVTKHLMAGRKRDGQDPFEDQPAGTDPSEAEVGDRVGAARRARAG